MSDLLVRPQRPRCAGCVLEVTPASAGWRHVGFEVVRLAGGQTSRRRRGGTGGLPGGPCGLGRNRGRRSYNFEASASAPACSTTPRRARVYAPAGVTSRSRPESPARDRGLHRARPGDGRGAGSSPAAMSREVRGERDQPAPACATSCPKPKPADSLLVVEVITPGGHWSSYPPHKHDTADGEAETALEETYYHRLKPAAGLRLPARLHPDDRIAR